MRAVKDPGPRLGNIILPRAAFLPLCVEGIGAKCHHSGPHTFRHLAGLVEQDLALDPEAGGRSCESLGTHIMLLFKLAVHLHPGWTGWGARVTGFQPPASPFPAPPPSLAQPRVHLTPHLRVVQGRKLESTSWFPHLKMGMMRAVNHLVLQLRVE